MFARSNFINSVSRFYGKRTHFPSSRFDKMSSIPKSDPAVAEAKTSILPAEMGLEEVMRVMDVASTLRREQELVEREFNLDKTKEMLRDKLRRTAETTGEELTPEQIEAAVNWYYDNLHEYKEPEKSFQWFMAHLYVRRKAILSVLLPLLFVVTAVWAFWFSPFAPFSQSNRLNRDLQSANQAIEKRIKSILSIAKSDNVKADARQLQKEANTYFTNREMGGLDKLHQRLKSMDSRLNEEFTLTVQTGENQTSAKRRDFEDESGKRVSGFYLIVQARDSNGNLLKRRIQNIENDKFKTVDTWGEKVPEAIYDRLKQDKKEDGILNETAFGKKNRGELEIQMIMPGADNIPIERSGQITDW